MADRRIDQKNSGRIPSRQRKSRLRQRPEKTGGKDYSFSRQRENPDNQMPRLYIKGIGMMAGLIIGAGVFALPYAFAQAGVLWGTVHLAVSLFIAYLLHQWYGEVSFYTKGRHRFVGYVEMYLGQKAKFFSLLTTLGSYYFSLLIYAIIGGIFLTNFTSLFNGHTVEFMTLLFFAAGGLMALFKVSRIAEINFYLTAPIVGFIVYLLFFSFPHIKTENFFSDGNWLMNKNWFLPYGVWLFSLTGFSAIPPTRDIFFNSSIKSFKRVVSISLFLAAAVYAIFIFSILGVSGSFTTVDALSGIKTVMGAKVMAIGSIMGFLGIFIILMRHKIVKILKIGDKEDLVAEIESKEIKIRKKLEIVILVGIISAVLYDIWNIVSKL